MTLVVVTLVLLACGFAALDAYRRCTAYRRDASADPRSWFEGKGAGLGSGGQSHWIELVEELAHCTDRRHFDAVLNHLTLEVDNRFRRSETAKMNWRICAAATVAGGLLTLWDSRAVAGFITSMGLCAGLLAARWSGMAERERRAGRQRWRGFLEWSRAREP